MSMAAIAVAAGFGGTGVPFTPPLSITVPEWPAMTQDVAITPFFVSGSYGDPDYSYSVASGSLPPGVTLDGLTGEVSGTPTTVSEGENTMSFRVTDESAATADSASLGWTVGAVTPTEPLDINDPDFPSMNQGVPITPFSAIASAGEPPYVYSIASGALPDGLSLNSSTGQVSGIPTTNGTGSAVFRVTDDALDTADSSSRSWTVTSAVGAPIIEVPLDQVVANSAELDFTLSATGSGLTWTIDDEPSGMTINASTGQVEWTAATGLYRPKITATNANGSDWSILNVAVWSTEETIDAAWLTAAGDPPYYLDTANCKYTQDLNVSTPRSAFAARADNVILEMQGHTITFGTLNDTPVTNGDFSDGTTGWDLTNSPGAFVKTDASYEAGNCYSGTTCLQITVPAGETYSFETTDEFTIPANMRYSVALWHNNKGSASNTISARISGVGGNCHRNKAGTFGVCSIKSGSELTGPLVITLTNGIASPQLFRLDNIMLTPSRCAGVAWPQDSTWTPDLSGSGGDGFTITGTAGAAIIEGAAGVDNVCAFAYSNSKWAMSGPIELQTHAGSINGQVGKCLKVLYTGELSLRGIKLNNQARGVRNREQYDGYAALCSAMNSGDCIIADVELMDSAQGGINLHWPSGKTGNLRWTDSTGKFRSKYTNGFGYGIRVLPVTNGHLIRNLTLDCETDPEASGRFLHIDSSSASGSLTLDNPGFMVKELPRNQEYGGYVIGGAYGIQIENASGPIAILGGSRKLIGDSGGILFRTSAQGGTSVTDVGPVWIVDVASFANPGYVIGMYSTDGAEYVITDAQITTNDAFCLFQNVNSNTFTLESPTITYVDDGSSHKPFNRDWKGTGTLKIRNGIFTDAGSRAWIQEGFDNDGGTSAGTAIASCEEDCVLTFEDDAQSPQVGINVTIRDAASNIVYGPVATDANGQVAPTVQWYYAERAPGVNINTISNPFTVETDFGAGTSDPWTLTDLTREPTFNVEGA